MERLALERRSITGAPFFYMPVPKARSAYRGVTSPGSELELTIRLGLCAEGVLAIEPSVHRSKPRSGKLCDKL